MFSRLSGTFGAWTATANKRVQFGYGLNYLIDIENAVIVDVEATRGLSGARDEFHLAAIVQNLKTLAMRIWRPPPNVPAAYVA
jgi:hypothetical protein